MKQPRSRASLVATVVACLSVAAAAISYLHPFEYPDEDDYWRLASNLVHTGTLSFDGLTPSAYRPPLVAWVLAPFTGMGWPMALVRPVFVIFYAASGALVGIFLCRAFNSSRWIPPLGTALVLGHPAYFFSAGNLYPQQVLTPLLLLALVLMCLKADSFSAVLWRSAGLGLITGISLLASAPAIFSLVPAFALLAWEDLGELRKMQSGRAYRTTAACLVVLACAAPYIARNARNVHPGIYLSLNSGINLLFGNSPRTTPTSGVLVDISEYLHDHENDLEFDLNRHLTTVALANINEDPGYYGHLYLRKLAAGFGNAVETATHGYNRWGTLAMWGYMALVWIGVGALLLLWKGSGARAGATVDRSLIAKSIVLILPAYLLSVAGYAIFFTRLRFRLPVDVMLAVLSAVGWGMLQLRRRKSG